MKPTVREVFRRNEDYESFRRALFDLNGHFDLELKDMLELGGELVRRYGGTDAVDACPAYRITRICLLEKAIADQPEASRELLREIFTQPKRLPESLGRIASLKDLWQLHRRIEENVAKFRLDIDRLPKGIVRERFSGGISQLLNVLYLFEREIERRAEADGHGD